MKNEKKIEKISHWKSLDEKYRTPEFLALSEKEFQSSPFGEEKEGGIARRQFMKLMGAGLALSSTACVRRPIQKIIPYNKRPPEVVIGISNYYASSFHDGRETFAVTVKTREGRPLFIQANPSFPGHDPRRESEEFHGLRQKSGLSIRAVSQILSLYDPDRLRTPIINSQDPKKRGNKLSIPRDWETLDKRIVEKMKKSMASIAGMITKQEGKTESEKKQGGIHILTPPLHSPSLEKLLKDFAKKTGAKIHFWNPINFSEILRASELCYGTASLPEYHYDKAKLILSVDADFLGTHLNPTESTRLFSISRKPEQTMSKLVSFQSVTSLTSLNADDNYGIKASHQLPLILAMIHELGVVQKKVSIDKKIADTAKTFANFHKNLPISHGDFKQLVSELWDNRGQSIVLAGGLQTKTKDTLSLQIAVNYLNSLLGNEGLTIERKNKTHQSHDQNLSDLISTMEAGEVGTLIINELNPAFNLPSSKNFKKALSQVNLVVATNNWMDETASLADLVVPAGHSMENWGDNKFGSGFVSIQQPTIRPLHNTRSFADSLITWAKALGKPLTSEENFYSLVKSHWTKKLGGEKAWMDFLQKGFKIHDSKKISKKSFNPSALEAVTVTLKEAPLELSLYEKVGIHDGTMTNVSWIQELPDPVSKIAWDNYLMISPVLAKEKGLRDGHIVEVKTNHHTMKLPVYISPGLHPGSVAIAIGYGHKKGGDLEKNVGFDVSDFILEEGKSFIHAGFAVEIKKNR